MAAVVENSDTDGENSSTTSHTFDFSGLSPASGNLLLVFVTFDGNDTYSSGFSGWTEVPSPGSGVGASQDCFVFAKESDGTETSTTATTTVAENSAFVIVEISNWDDSGALLAALTDSRRRESGKTFAESAILSGLTEADYLYIQYCGLSRGTNTITFSTNYTEVTQYDSTGAGGVVMGAGQRTIPSSTGDSPDNLTFANSNHEESVTGLIAISPGGGDPSNTTAPLGGIAGDGGLAGRGGIAGPGGGIVGSRAYKLDDSGILVPDYRRAA